MVSKVSQNLCSDNLELVYCLYLPLQIDPFVSDNWTPYNWLQISIKGVAVFYSTDANYEATKCDNIYV